MKTNTTAGPSSGLAGMMAEFRAKSQLQKGIYLLLGLAGVYAIVMILTNWWVCDDAFISFRYAKHLADGQGLIYNLGEKVEGYSNFLWTVLVAAGMKAGIDPVLFSLVLGGLSYLAAVVATALVSSRLFGSKAKGGIFLPVAALLLLVHHEMHLFATSGLETMFTTALVMFGFLALVSAEREKEILVAGVWLTLAALARPDGLLFTFMGGVYVVLTERRIRPALVFALPALLLYLPYFVWRFSYYGYLFPNTYYAKSGDLSYWSQGWVYLWIYLKSYWLLLVMPVAGIGLLSARWLRGKVLDAAVWRASFLALLFIVPYGLYIVKVGGDFMFGRFWIVITPLMYLLIEMALRSVVKQRGVLLAAAVVCVAMTLLRIDLYADDPKAQISGVANEPAYYPRSHYTMAREQGERLKKYLGGLDVQIAFRGQHAMQVYYSEVPVAIEAATGLTDEYVAHLPLTKRGRPGHEKNAPLEYLKSRGVEFMLVGVGTPGSLADSMTQISFGGYMARMLQYNSTVMAHLRRYPEVKFMDIPAFLDDWIAQLPYRTPDVARQSYDFFLDFYFKNSPDPERQARFRAALGTTP